MMKKKMLQSWEHRYTQRASYNNESKSYRTQTHYTCSPLSCSDMFLPLSLNLYSAISYPIELDDDTGLAIAITIGAICQAGAVSQNGAVELAGALGIVPYTSAVRLEEILVRCTLVVLLGLLRVVVGYKKIRTHIPHKTLFLIFLCE